MLFCASVVVFVFFLLYPRHPCEKSGIRLTPIKENKNTRGPFFILFFGEKKNEVRYKVCSMSLV